MSDNLGMLTLPKLYALTDCQLSNCSHDEIVKMMLAGGVRLIQLRDKEISSREMLDVAREILKQTRDSDARLIINDRVDVALTSNADGVHLGQGDTPVEEAREILGDDKIIGVSTHSLDQFRGALETSADYIAIGPIFPTKTKENSDPVVGLELLREARALSDRPIVAIGGITIERAPEVMAAGADSVAVISALYPWPEKLELTSKPDILGAVRSFIEILEGSVREQN